MIRILHLLIIFISGVCSNTMNGEYRCACQGRARGQRCELTQFCDVANPLNGQCKHGGRCLQGPGFPVCECLRGYRSKRLSWDKFIIIRLCDDNMPEGYHQMQNFYMQ
jgi:hypothetical protein